MTFFLLATIFFLFGYVFWLKSVISSRTKSMSFFARAASRLMHSVDGELRKAVAEKRAQRDLLILAGALASLLEENPELLTSEAMEFLWHLSCLFGSDNLVKEKRELVSRMEALRVRMNKN